MEHYMPVDVKLSIIVPCFNEEASLRPLLERLEPVVVDSFGGRAEVVAIDDGSTDDTFRLLTELKSRFPFLVTKSHGRNLGLPAAWHTGAEAARSELVCTLDADMQYRPEEVSRLYSAWLESGVDIVQGVRVRPAKFTDSRYMLSRGLNRLLNGLFRMDLADNKSGFLICRRDRFLTLLARRDEFRYFQALIMVAAHKSGLTYTSIPTPFDERSAGRSFLGDLPLAVTTAVTADLCRAFLTYRTGRNLR